MLLCVILFTLLGASLGQKCDVYCKKGTYPVAKAGDYVCSPGFPSRYAKKGYLCVVRLSVSRYSRVRLKASHFSLRTSGKHCTLDYIRLDNRFNPVKKTYTMDKVCSKNQFHKSGDIIINTSQVKLTFRVDPKSKKGVSGKKWRMALQASTNPLSRSMSTCPFTMDNMEKGFNRRHVQVSANKTTVIKFCCQSQSLSKDDYALVMCKEDANPQKQITKNGEDFCVSCSLVKTGAVVEADIVSQDSNKKIQCTCSSTAGVEIGEDCSGGVPCLDTKDNAFCDTDNICKCPNGMLTDSENTYCAPAVDVGDDCSQGEICNSTYGRSECDGSTCVCPDPYYLNDDGAYCTKTVDLGDDCSRGEICNSTYERTECDGTTCVCSSPYYPNDNGTFCTKDVGLGDDCSKGEICNSTYGRSICDGSTCVCPDTYTADATGTFCTKDVAIGEDCSGELGCLDTFSRATCVNNVCACPSGTSASNDNSYCSYKSAYNGFCEYTLDCTSTRSKKCNTATKKCICESSYTYYKSICSLKSIYGQTCETTNDCAVTNGKCTNRKCLCKSASYKKKTNTNCAPVCTQKNKATFFSGLVVCNKTNNVCYKCKCENPPRKLTYKGQKNKNSCKKAWKCKKNTKVGGSKCG